MTLRVYLAVLFVFGCLGVINAEGCDPINGHQDCQNTICDEHHALECSTQHLCTCVDDGRTCATVVDCFGTCTFFGRNGRWHCINGQCRCFLSVLIKRESTT